MELFVFALNVSWEMLEEATVHVDSGWAALMWALNFLKFIDFVDSVVMEARFTEIEFVLTITHINLQLFVFRLWYLTLTDLTKT